MLLSAFTVLQMVEQHTDMSVSLEINRFCLRNTNRGQLLAVVLTEWEGTTGGNDVP